MKSAKNQARAKQHPEAELLLLRNYSLSSSTLSSKNKKRYSETCAKNKCGCFHVIIELITMKMRLEMKNRSRRYVLNRLRPIHRHNYTKHKIYLNMMIILCIKVHLSKI